MAGVCIRTGDARGRGENAILEAQTARWKWHGFFVLSRHEASSPRLRANKRSNGRGGQYGNLSLSGLTELENDSENYLLSAFTHGSPEVLLSG